MKTSGIYKIQSTIKPERIYIGSAVNYRGRKRYHLYQLRHNKHINNKLQHHYNKYGESDLNISLIISCDKSLLIANEQFFIDSYKPWFNIAQKAGSNLGYKASDETRKKMSIAMKGRKCTEETKRKLSEINKGRPYPLKGMPGHIAWNKGLKTGPLSNEHIKKLSIAKTGKKRGPMSEETKNKISKANKGHIGCTWYMHSDEIKKLIGLSAKLTNKGRIHTEVHKLKISEGGKRAWKLRRLNKVAI